MATNYKRVGDLIDRMEMKINAGLATPEYLEYIQQQLHDLPASAIDQDSQYGQYIYELRALTYRALGRDDDALKSIRAALNEAGSAKKLHSSILQSYILKNPGIIPKHKTHSDIPKKHVKLADLSESQQAFMNKQGLDQGQNVDLLFRSPTQFAVMYILSGGNYQWYWVYKNWQAIQDASGRKISPFWRTFFTIFYIWPLFRSLTLLAKSRGYKEKFSGGWFAAGYILTTLLTLLVGFATSSKLALALAQIIFIGANATFYVLEQRAVAFATSKQPAVKRRPINYIEWLFVVIGALLTIWFAYNSFFYSKHITSVPQQINATHSK